MPGCSGGPVVTNARVYYTTRAATGASAPGIPHALKGRKFLARLGRTAPRDREAVFTRHCERSEAIHLSVMPRHGLLRSARNDGVQKIVRHTPLPTALFAIKFSPTNNNKTEETMRGVVFTGERGLELMPFEDPTPDAHDVVIEMKASGMCGSDLHQYRRPKGQARATGIPVPEGPVIAGHEP